MQTSDQKPPRRSRSARLFGWCWRHKLLSLVLFVLSIPVLFMVLVFAPLYAMRLWAAFGYHPDIVVEGQLLDYDTQKPLADVRVAVLVRPWDYLYGPLVRFGEGGFSGRPPCGPASAVVRTDAGGRYGYRVSFDEATDGGRFAQVDTTIRPYRYGYEAVHADDGKRDYELYPIDGRSKISPRPPYQDAARAMAMRKIPVDGDRDLRIKNSVDPYCTVRPDAQRIDGWVERAAVIAEDAWREWCRPEGENFSDLHYVTFVGHVRRFMALREQIFYYRFWNRKTGHLARGTDEYRDVHQPMYQGHVQSVPGFPWPGHALDVYPIDSRDFTADEKAQACAFWKRDRLTTIENWGIK